MNASDGTGKTNLSDNGLYVYDESPSFSPDGQKIAYDSFGVQASNPEGDQDIYVMNADGTGKTNLTNNGLGVQDHIPYYSPDGQKIAYTSDGGAQPSNPEGDQEVYVMNADGTGQKNLTNNGQNGSDVYDFAYYAEFSPDGQKITYATGGVQASNPEGDYELYVMNTSDGSGKINLTNNGSGVSELFSDYSPDGQKIVYTSDGVQASNPEGESELYVMSAQDGSGKKNITNNGVRDFYAEWGR
jgi:TolB protein